MQQYQTYNSSYGYQNPIAGHTQQSQQQAQAGPGPADRGGQRQGAVANRTSANSSGGNSGSATILSKYELLGKIGEGTYGLVYLAYARDNPAKQYAIKTFKTARVSGSTAAALTALPMNCAVRPADSQQQGQLLQAVSLHPPARAAAAAAPAPATLSLHTTANSHTPHHHQPSTTQHNLHRLHHPCPAQPA